MTTTETASRPVKGERRIQILQTLAQMLEDPAGEKITTAGLAKRLAVSEAALYRHFASKAKMYEGLIEFIESSLLGLLKQIEASDAPMLMKLQQSVQVMLVFAQKNAGMARVLIGDVLIYENERLQARVTQLIERLQATLKQTLRDLALETGWQPSTELGAYSDFWMNWVVGRWHRFVRSGFKQLPTEGFDAVWTVMGIDQPTAI